MKKYKLAILDSHPIQYHIPLFRELSAKDNLEVVVYFCCKWGLEEREDPGFGKKFKWDIPLLDGYQHKFLKNYALNPKPTFFGQITPGIIKELKQKKYDAILLHGYTIPTNWFVFLTKFITKTPIILRGEADTLKQTGRIKGAIKKIILTKLFQKIDAFLYSYELNKEYYKSFGASEEKLFFLPCAVDNDFFQTKAEELKGRENESKKSLGIKNLDLSVVLYAGKFIKRKRVKDLLEAYYLIKDKAQCNIVLVGDGSEKSNLEQFVKERNLENVYFAGFKNQGELPLVYSIADVLALPSELDPSPKVINEAMNFGVPIIATDKVGTATDLVLKPKTGFVYKAGDIKSLAFYLEKILKDSNLRTQLGKRALEVVKEWSFEKDCKGILQALDYIQKNHEKRRKIQRILS